MNEIARWTTPSLIYKPSLVDVADVVDICLTVKQLDRSILEKGMDEAMVSNDGFVWHFSQEETSALSTIKDAAIKIDYKDSNGERYTTREFKYKISDSGKQEVM